MIDLDGRLDADGEALPDAWISGLTDRPTVVGFGDTYGSIDLKLSERIQQAPARWGEVAHAAGYADQSHLNREFRALAGTTPSDFVRRLIPEGGVIGDRSH